MSSGMGIPFMYDPMMMGMGGMYGGMGMYNTNYLGGVSLPAKLNNDTFHLIDAKDKECKNQLKTIGKVLLGVVGYMALATIMKGKAPKSTSKAGSNWFSDIGKTMKGWFKKPATTTPPAPPTATP